MEEKYSWADKDTVRKELFSEDFSLSIFPESVHYKSEELRLNKARRPFLEEVCWVSEIEGL